MYEGAPSDTIKMGILNDMVPESVRHVIRQQKPDAFAKLKQVLKDEAKEHRELTGAKELNSKGLHAAEVGRWGPRQDDLPCDHPEDPAGLQQGEVQQLRLEAEVGEGDQSVDTGGPGRRLPPHSPLSAGHRAGERDCHHSLQYSFNFRN